MKKILHFSIIIIIAFFTYGCQKKDSNPINPTLEEGIYPKVGKKYFYLQWDLDMDNNKDGQPSNLFEMFTQKNYSIGGFSDVYKIITIYDNAPEDTIFEYYRFINGKDIYTWYDTSLILNKKNQINNIINSLSKILQKYAWVPFALFSKNDYEIYYILPPKYIITNINGINVTSIIELKGQNLGYENITVPYGNFKTKKIKHILSYLFVLPNEQIKLEVERYYYFSEELGWYIKIYQPTKFFYISGVPYVFYGVLLELSAFN